MLKVKTHIMFTYGFEKRMQFLQYFFCRKGRFPSLPGDFQHYFTMILLRFRIFVVDTGFEPGTSTSEVWCATNEPPHLQYHLSS